MLLDRLSDEEISLDRLAELLDCSDFRLDALDRLLFALDRLSDGVCGLSES